MDSDFEDLYDNFVDANQEDTQLVDEVNEEHDEIVGENDISKKREFVATVKGISVEAIVEAKVLHAIGDDEGLLQRLKQKRNILYLNVAMLQDAFDVVSGRKLVDLKKYPTREIQADFIRYQKMLSTE
jgi:hypothetical protein